MILAITGSTGNMGQAALGALADVEGIDTIRLLAHSEKRMKKLIKANKRIAGKIEPIKGGMSDEAAIKKLTDGADLVINMAAVIPPKSDSNPKGALACNDIGADVLVSALEKLGASAPALIHISTVAVYGHRAGAHPFGRVGDPLLASPLDVYSATKMRGEFRVLESKLKKWVVLRQTAMLHPQMLAENMSDGLMFHTTYDAPLEWATAHDSGLLIRRIVERFISDTMPDNFWRRVFNIAGGKSNREYGYMTFEQGFKIIGGSTTDFFKPFYSATRNFHGVWYLDGDELNEMFGFRTQTTADYWKEIANAHPVFKLGKLCPKALIRFFVFRRLLKHKNSPSYWAKHGDEAKLIAYFGSRENYEALKSDDWSTYALPDPEQLKALEDNAQPVYYGFDITKPDSELTEADAAAAAEAHGGKLIDKFDGNMYKKLLWETQDGERFAATAYTVLRAGHWYNRLYKEFVWDFDRLAKKDKVFASVWYDTHSPDEDYVYSLDADFNAHCDKYTQTVLEAIPQE